jgi:hypothetical protein
LLNNNKEDKFAKLKKDKSIIVCMHEIYQVPLWFLKLDIAMELIFAVITLLVCLYSFKIYKLAEQRQSKIFGISFLLISLSYFVRFIISTIMAFKLNTSFLNPNVLYNLNYLSNIGIYVYMLLFIAGLLTLAYMTFKTKNFEVYILLLITIILAIVFSFNAFYVFYILFYILLAFILVYYIQNYIKSKNKKTFIVLIAFGLLFLSSIYFMIPGNNIIYYMISHFFELMAYLLILTDLIIIIKK